MKIIKTYRNKNFINIKLLSYYKKILNVTICFLCPFPFRAPYETHLRNLFLSAFLQKIVVSPHHSYSES
jgi:hypothetical protein